jgi:hypothetical protein
MWDTRKKWGLFSLSAALTLSGCSGGIDSSLMAALRTGRVYTSVAQKVPSGACSRITAIELLNASGQALAFTGPLGLSLLAPASKSFYSDSACTTASSSPVLSGMTGKANFYFKGSATGSVAISANLLILLTTSQTETINAASPTPSPTPTSIPTPSSTPPPTTSVACQTNYYVSAAGSDSNNGTSSTTPWATIAKVNNPGFNYTAGTCLNFRGGDNFSGNLDLDGNSNVSGPSASNPIVVQSYGTGDATITSSQGGAQTAAIFVSNVPGIVIQNLIVRAGPVTQYGIQVAGSTSGVIQKNDVGGFTTTSTSDAAADVYVGSSTMLVYGNMVHGLSGPSSLDDHGIHVAWVSGNITIQGNTIYNIGGRSSSQGALSGYSGNGISFTGSACNGSCSHLIERNLVHDVGGNNNECGGPSGILVYQLTDAITTRMNEVHHVQPLNAVYPGGCDWDGIDMDAGVTNAIVEYNFVHDNFGPGLLVFMADLGNGWGPNTYRYNISQNDYTGGYNQGYFGAVTFVGKFSAVSYFYNNTIFFNANVPNSPAVAWADGSSPANGSTFENNLIVTGANSIALKCNGPDPATNTTFKNNAYYSTTGVFSVGNNCAANAQNLAQWQASVLGGDTGANTNNPMFAGTTPASACTWTPSATTSPAACLTGYQLQSGSPDIGTGISIASPGTMNLFGIAIPNGTGSGYNIGAY